MTIKTIEYERVFALRQYENEKIRVEVVVNDGEDPKQLIEEARAFVEGCHKPVGAWDGWHEMDRPLAPPSTAVGQPLPEIQSEKPQTTADKIKAQILECTDATVLKSFELLARNNEELKAIYDNRLKELRP